MPRTCDYLLPLKGHADRAGWRGAALVAVAAIAVYANSVWNGFAFDDLVAVQHNDHVVNLEWLKIWHEGYWPLHDGVAPDILYRPLTVWTYLANQALTPGAPWAFHLVNVLLHAIVSVMVFMIAWRLFADRAIAVVTGLLFAVHPLHVEVVSNIVGRAELLSTVWSLAAILVYLPTRPLLHESGPLRRSAGHGLLAAVCFFGAMLCKETPAALLGAFVLIDVWRWMRWGVEGRPRLMRWLTGQSVRYYLPVCGMFGLYLLMRIGAVGLMQDVHRVHPIVNPLVDATLLERIVTPFAILSKYLGLMFWPAVLSADYSAPSFMPIGNPLAPGALIGILLMLLGAILVAKHWRSGHPLLLTLGLFGVSYALVANVLRIGTIFGERLFYLPSVFMLMPVAWAAVTGWRWMDSRMNGYRWLVRFGGLGAAAATCIALSVRTIVRNPDWHDNVTLALATAHDNPQSAKACYWAGTILVNQGPEPWMVDFGATLLQRACTLFPTFGMSDWELAKYYGRKNELAKSVIYLVQAARCSPGGEELRAALKAVIIDLKNHAPEQYMPELKAYMNDHATDPAGHLAMALALRSQHELSGAERECRAALVLDGNFQEAGAELAMVYFDEGHKELGIDDLRRYVICMKSCFDARCTLASALMELDPATHPAALAEAAMNLDHAATLKPDDGTVGRLRRVLMRKRLAAARRTGEVDSASANAYPATPPRPLSTGHDTPPGSFPGEALVRGGR